MSASGESDAPEPRWLTSDQLAAWRGFVKLAGTLPAVLESQLQQDSKLSFIEYNVLAHLSEQPERRIRMSELAALASAELSRMSHMVTRLEKRGFARREPDPRNGRYTQVILTDAGYTHLAGTAPRHAAQVLDVFIDVLTPDELRTLRRISDKVLARVEGGQRQAEGAQPAAVRTA
ncbi:MarR family winged helix-turn-helix transcriptional regulator [Umezawaea endophytica]|uniref:MarR family transcriptional regulator n=1 Tax=Umezawaea endophytica TaxID=1654476 RepID=A0A9X2VIZ6_9PSEU|nr:MarR family transcriptional regulator [Umezawaea endophytica]MCS7476962.1 MarR family transcriptional regulator [Umezawaea endophytica]